MGSRASLGLFAKKLVGGHHCLVVARLAGPRRAFVSLQRLRRGRVKNSGVRHTHMQVPSRLVGIATNTYLVTEEKKLLHVKHTNRGVDGLLEALDLAAGGVGKVRRLRTPDQVGLDKTSDTETTQTHKHTPSSQKRSWTQLRSRPPGLCWRMSPAPCCRSHRRVHQSPPLRNGKIIE